jgi:hypothetical protein
VTFPSELLESSLAYLVGLEWGIDILKVDSPFFFGSTPAKKTTWFEIVKAESDKGVVRLDKLSDREFTVIHFPKKRGDNVILVKTDSLPSIELDGQTLASLILRRAEIHVEEIIEQGMWKELEAKKKKASETL